MTAFAKRVWLYSLSENPISVYNMPLSEMMPLSDTELVQIQPRRASTVTLSIAWNWKNPLLRIAII